MKKGSSCALWMLLFSCLAPAHHAAACDVNAGEALQYATVSFAGNEVKSWPVGSRGIQFGEIVPVELPNGLSFGLALHEPSEKVYASAGTRFVPEMVEVQIVALGGSSRTPLFRDALPVNSHQWLGDFDGSNSVPEFGKPGIRLLLRKNRCIGPFEP
jgi:hypothetical protein